MKLKSNHSSSNQEAEEAEKKRRRRREVMAMNVNQMQPPIRPQLKEIHSLILILNLLLFPLELKETNERQAGRQAGRGSLTATVKAMAMAMVIETEEAMAKVKVKAEEEQRAKRRKKKDPEKREFDQEFIKTKSILGELSRRFQSILELPNDENKKDLKEDLKEEDFKILLRFRFRFRWCCDLSSWCGVSAAYKLILTNQSINPTSASEDRQTDNQASHQR